jgi:hypothetical protein
MLMGIGDVLSFKYFTEFQLAIETATDWNKKTTKK